MNGFLFDIFDKLIQGLKYLNVVELPKLLARKVFSKDNQKQQKGAERIAVDIFIVFKWFLLFLGVILGLDGPFWKIMFWYLALTNLYTYFYYHVWMFKPFEHKSYEQESLDELQIRAKRRFFNLLQAVAFNTASFFYFYKIAYSTHFNMPKNLENLRLFVYSILNVVGAGSSSGIVPDLVGSCIVGVQFVTTFIFLTIIFSRVEMK